MYTLRDNSNAGSDDDDHGDEHCTDNNITLYSLPLIAEHFTHYLAYPRQRVIFQQITSNSIAILYTAVLSSTLFNILLYSQIWPIMVHLGELVNNIDSEPYPKILFWTDPGNLSFYGCFQASLDQAGLGNKAFILSQGNGEGIPADMNVGNIRILYFHGSFSELEDNRAVIS